MGLLPFPSFPFPAIPLALIHFSFPFSYPRRTEIRRLVSTVRATGDVQVGKRACGTDSSL
jgi:hypothetical protein